MKKLMLVAAAALPLAVFATASFANEEAAPADAAPAAEAPAATEVELEDGTKVSIEGDVVSVVGADGTKTPAPDGEHKGKDGSVITVKEGKLVH